MRVHSLRGLRFAFGSVVLGAAFSVATAAAAQGSDQSKPAEGATAGSTISVQANLVMVPAVVFDKHGAPVAGLTKDDFALSVDNKPQTIRYFDRETDVPLTVGLLVDISRSQTSVLDDEQKASEKFLQSMLAPASASRPADKAFIMQFGRTAELLQDVTDSRPLLEAGLKQIGTEAPGTADDQDSTAPSNSGNNGSGSSSANNGGNNGGGYGRGRNGGGNGNGGPEHGSHGGGGTVLYDSLFLSSNDVVGKQTGRRAVILLTDGVDRHSKESLTEAIEAAQRANVVVYAIYYKGEQHRDFNRGGYPGGRGGYGGYPGGGRGGYPGGYPGGGGNPGSDGTYPDPDGKKILQRICGETGGHMFEVKGKGSVDAIYKQIGDELRAQYRLGFTPSAEAAATGYHPLQVTLTNAAGKKLEVQTRNGYYTGAAKGY